MEKYDFWEKTNDIVELEWYYDRFTISANEAFRNAFFSPVMNDNIRDTFMDMRLVHAMIAYQQYSSLKELADYLMSLDAFSTMQIKEVVENGENRLEFSRKDASDEVK